ncbi:MAG: 30S ribosome-binding factor RbfA [Planctomycetes bacterium]|nr:30S ribosome-binding factor RbfA [Planctomycetota bacterium]
MNDRRIARLQEQIKQVLAETLQRDLADPKLGLVTITRVEVDAEFTVCKAFWSVLGDDRVRRDSAGVLARARGLCQRAIGKAIHTRTVPRLEFAHDEGIAGAIRVNRLLQQLEADRRAREAARGPGTPPEPQP